MDHAIIRANSCYTMGRSSIEPSSDLLPIDRQTMIRDITMDHHQRQLRLAIIRTNPCYTMGSSSFKPSSGLLSLDHQTIIRDIILDYHQRQFKLAIIRANPCYIMRTSSTVWIGVRLEHPEELRLNKEHGGFGCHGFTWTHHFPRSRKTSK